MGRILTGEWRCIQHLGKGSAVSGIDQSGGVRNGVSSGENAEFTHGAASKRVAKTSVWRQRSISAGSGHSINSYVMSRRQATPYILACHRREW